MNPAYTLVADRAEHRCEYCHAPELVFNFPFEVEHIIPTSKQGSNDDSNLALSCRSCNLRKGNRTSGNDPTTQVETPFFHPRQELWNDHFDPSPITGEISGLTETGRTTIYYLDMNSAPQLAARQLWIQWNLFP